MFTAILDYGMGNLVSVKNALEAVGAEVRVVDRGEALLDAGAVVLPGVGAFGKGMEGLRARGFIDALEENIRVRKKPFLGICLGLQLLATTGTELGEHSGLGWIKGSVRRLDAPGLRVPHIGWNDVHGKSPLLAGIPAGASFYFVHSYHLAADDPAVVTGETDYGSKFAAIVDNENLHAVQFHPEKSHKHGLALLKNFLALAKRA